MQSTLQQTGDKSETALITPWRLAFAGILILSFVVYAGALTGTAIMDDKMLLTGAGTGVQGLLHCFTRPFLKHYFRPLVSVSFYMDRLISGGTPFFSHQVNILIHLLSTACLMGLLLSAFRSRRIALFGGLLFALQPAQDGAVAWIGGRTDSLCALFVVLFAWALVAAVKASGRQRTWLLAASAAAYAAALLTKEQTLSLLPLVPLAFACFADKERGQPRGIGWRASIPFALLCIVYTLVWQIFFPDLRAGLHGIWEQLSLAGRTFLYYTLVQLTPTPRLLYTTSLGGMLRAGAFTIWLGYGLLAVYLLLLWRWLRRAPAAAWFLALALLAILPVSNLVPIPTMTVAPYRAAVSGIGIAALLGALLAQVTRRGLSPLHARPLAIVCGLLGFVCIVWYAGLSCWSAAQWSDELHLCRLMVRYDPDSLFARLNLIGTYSDGNEPKQAGRETEAALTRIFDSQIWRQPEAALHAFRTDPRIAYFIHQSMGYKTPPQAWLGMFYARLGTAWLVRGDLQSSQACLAAGLQFDHGNVEASLAVGKYDCAVGKYAEAIQFLRYAQSAEPSLADTYLLLGQAYSQQKQWPQAKAQFARLVGMYPWLGPAYLGLADAQQHLGDMAGAQQTLQTAQRKAVLTTEQAQRMLDSTLQSTR